jgi:integrase
LATIRARKDKQGTMHFHVQVRMLGYPSRTATFPTRRMAERWAATVEAEMIEGRHFKNAGARRHTLSEAINRYSAEEAPKKRDVRTRLIRLRWWKEQLGHLKLADVTADILADHRGKLEREPAREGGKARKPATVNRYLAYLSHVFTVAKKEWRWIDSDPFESVSKLPESKGRIRFLTEDERARLLEETAKDAQLHLLVVLALATASRAGELLKLRWRDVELNEGRGVLWDTKNDQARAVWLHGEAQRLLHEHRRRQGDAPNPNARVFARENGDPYLYRAFFEDACERAGIVEFRFHDLRHSAATYLARMGATEQQLRAIGGWKSNVVARYVHLAAEDTRALQERMNDAILKRKP